MSLVGRGTGVLGIDEAGRGSLLGPLVVGGFWVPDDRLDQLRPMGVRDSKALAPERREQVYRDLEAVGLRVAISLPPRTIDQWRGHGRLNDLEARTFAELVRRMRPAVAFVDACDPVASRFGRQVERFSGGVARVDARHHADRDVAVVSAASIVAKVRRDQSIGRLRERLGVEIGTGYPSDERTVAFCRDWMRGSPAEPSWLRRSWSTYRRLKAEHATRTLEEFRE